jgi:hypothetical protein
MMRALSNDIFAAPAIRRALPLIVGTAVALASLPTLAQQSTDEAQTLQEVIVRRWRRVGIRHGIWRPDRRGRPDLHDWRDL